MLRAMPFRDDDAPRTPTAIDPLTRFSELFAALDAGRGFMGDRAPLRLAAVTLVTTPGDAGQLAAQVRTRDAVLEPHYGGWTSSVPASVRLVLAAALVRVCPAVATLCHVAGPRSKWTAFWFAAQAR